MKSETFGLSDLSKQIKSCCVRLSAVFYDPTLTPRECISVDGLQTSRFCGRREREINGLHVPTLSLDGF